MNQSILNRKYIKVCSTVKCTPDRFAMSERVARLQRLLRNNLKGEK